MACFDLVGNGCVQDRCGQHMLRQIVVAAVCFAAGNQYPSMKEKLLQGALGDGGGIPCVGLCFALALDVLRAKRASCSHADEQLSGQLLLRKSEPTRTTAVAARAGLH